MPVRSRACLVGSNPRSALGNQQPRPVRARIPTNFSYFDWKSLKPRRLPFADRDRAVDASRLCHECCHHRFHADPCRSVAFPAAAGISTDGSVADAIHVLDRCLGGLLRSLRVPSDGLPARRCGELCPRQAPRRRPAYGHRDRACQPKRTEPQLSRDPAAWCATRRERSPRSSVGRQLGRWAKDRGRPASFACLGLSGAIVGAGDWTAQRDLQSNQIRAVHEPFALPDLKNFRVDRPVSEHACKGESAAFPIGFSAAC